MPTAFYLTAAQVPEATTVGQFPAPGGDQWGALLQKDSPLTACVSAAVDELQSSGELPAIEKQWMSDATDAPVAAVALRTGLSDGRTAAQSGRRPSAPRTRRGLAIAAVSTRRRDRRPRRC